MFENKKLIVLEVLIVIVLLVWYGYKTIIPEVKETFGSSDKIINTNSYKNMIELNIDNTNFILVINNDDKVYHMFFLEKTSLVLHNQGIENNDIDNALKKTITLLIENNILKQESNITVTRYGDEDYKEFITSFNNILKRYSITKPIKEEQKTSGQKALELNIRNDLVEFDYYSKSISGLGNKKINEKTKSHKELADNVYKKIEEYIFNNNIETLEKNNTELVITLIPDKSLKYYPTYNSWYYVKDRKIYAYIEFDINGNTKGYCYKGSIDLRNEGECTS